MVDAEADHAALEERLLRVVADDDSDAETQLDGVIDDDREPGLEAVLAELILDDANDDADKGTVKELKTDTEADADPKAVTVPLLVNDALDVPNALFAALVLGDGVSERDGTEERLTEGDTLATALELDDGVSERDNGGERLEDADALSNEEADGVALDETVAVDVADVDGQALGISDDESDRSADAEARSESLAERIVEALAQPENDAIAELHDVEVALASSETDEKGLCVDDSDCAEDSVAVKLPLDACDSEAQLDGKLDPVAG